MSYNRQFRIEDVKSPRNALAILHRVKTAYYAQAVKNVAQALTERVVEQAPLFESIGS